MIAILKQVVQESKESSNYHKINNDKLKFDKIFKYQIEQKINILKNDRDLLEKI